jgi:hypothetical protein
MYGQRCAWSVRSTSFLEAEERKNLVVQACTTRTHFINRRVREGGLDRCSVRRAVQTIFPKGSHQNRRWTALRSLRIGKAIRRVASLQDAYRLASLYCYTGGQQAGRIPCSALASPDSGANAHPPIYEMSSISLFSPCRGTVRRVSNQTDDARNNDRENDG